MIHADRQCLAALRREPRDLRRHDAAGAVLNKANSLRVFLILADCRAANGCVVPVHVLGCAVHRYIGAELQWQLEVRRKDCVVDDMYGACALCNFGNSSDVRTLHRRVSGGFSEYHAGVVADRGSDLVWIGRIREGKFDTETRQYLCRKPVSAAIGDIGNDRVRTCIQKCQQYCLGCRHTSAKAGTIDTAFQVGELQFQRPYGWITGARI